MFARQKLERTRDMPQLKREIMARLFDYISRKPYNEWWHYKGEFKFDDKEYELECDVKFDNIMFTYKNLHICYKTIEIDIQDMIDAGMLD